MIDFYSLFELAQIKAINFALEPTLESIWRIRCRNYSQLFNTPLHIVEEELDANYVLQALYENQYTPSLVEEELQELSDILNKIKDPTYSRMTAQETEDLVDAVLNREIKRASLKKAPTQETIKAAIKADEVKPQKPKNGSMNFSELEKMDSSNESNKGNFED